MVKIEFKITDEQGYSRMIEKVIKNEKDFEKFKQEINTEVKSLDLMVKYELKKRIKNENSGQSTTGDTSPVKDIGGKIQRINL